MTHVWGDVNARARGLATHLLTGADFTELARAASLAELEKELQQRGYAVGGETGLERSVRLELAIRRRAAERMATIARWCGDRTRALAVLFEDEDRRSLRVLLRGAVRSIGRDERLSGLIATANLPEAALAELAAKDSPRAVASVLAAWGNPYGPVLLPEAGRQRPDVWRLEAAINREFGRRAVRTAVRGGAHLLAYARQIIDVENAFTAAQVAHLGGTKQDVASLFVPGGRVLQAGDFDEARPVGEVLDRIARAFVGSPLSDVFRRYGGHAGRLESAVLAAQVLEQVIAARREPLGVAPVIAFALRVRAEVVGLQRVVWGVRLGAPRELLTSEFSAVA